MLADREGFTYYQCLSLQSSMPILLLIYCMETSGPTQKQPVPGDEDAGVGSVSSLRCCLLSTPGHVPHMKWVPFTSNLSQRAQLACDSAQVSIDIIEKILPLLLHVYLGTLISTVTPRRQAGVGGAALPNKKHGN